MTWNRNMVYQNAVNRGTKFFTCSDRLLDFELSLHVPNKNEFLNFTELVC